MVLFDDFSELQRNNFIGGLPLGMQCFLDLTVLYATLYQVFFKLSQWLTYLLALTRSRIDQNPQVTICPSGGNMTGLSTIPTLPIATIITTDNTTHIPHSRGLFGPSSVFSISCENGTWVAPGDVTIAPTPSSSALVVTISGPTEIEANLTVSAGSTIHISKFKWTFLVPTTIISGSTLVNVSDCFILEGNITFQISPSNWQALRAN